MKSLTLSLLLTVCLLSIGTAVERLEVPAEVAMSSTLREAELPELPPSRIGKILNRYYAKGLGGREVWSRVVSIRVRGRLTIGAGEFEMQAIQRKPNLIKVAIGPEDAPHMLLGFDGATSWQRQGAGADPIPMGEVEARRFIHSANFGNHLIFPYREGKVIEYIDTVRVGDALCHHLRVTLDTGYVVDYYLDIEQYLELKVVNFDQKSERTNTVLYSDYKYQDDMPVAQEVKSFEMGELVSSLSIESIKVNTGVMPWMFNMPDGH